MLNADLDARRPTVDRGAGRDPRLPRRGALPEVQRVDVTKVAPGQLGQAAWEAEADVWQPNPTLKSLGIETGRPVLDQTATWFGSTLLLNVLEYELSS